MARKSQEKLKEAAPRQEIQLPKVPTPKGYAFLKYIVFSFGGQEGGFTMPKKIVFMDQDLFIYMQVSNTLVVCSSLSLQRKLDIITEFLSQGVA